MLRLSINGLTRTFALRGARNAHSALYSSTEHSELKKAVRRIRTQIEVIPEDDLPGFVYRNLDEVYPETITAKAYETVLDLLICNDRPVAATSILRRMKGAGFVASNQIKSKMLAVAMALPQKGEGLPEHLAIQLATMVKNPHYTEKHLYDLTKLMQKLRLDRNMVALVVGSFWEEKGKGYVPPFRLVPAMADALVRAEKIDKAFELIEQVPKTDKLPQQKTILIAYTQLLTALRDTWSWNKAYVARLLDGLSERDLSPPIQIFNLLLSCTIRSQGYLAVQHLYSLLLEMGTTEDITPNRSTFTILFEMHQSLRIRSPRHFKKIMPRRLYYDLMIATKRKADPIVLTEELMNVILNTFMRGRDYAGAFVVLSSCADLHIPLSHTTYYAVVKRIVHRMWNDIASPRRIKEGHVKWGDCFLGVPFNEVQLKESVVDHILSVVSRETFALENPLFPLWDASKPRAATDDDKEAKFKMPTMKMMESVNKPEPLDFVYHTLPLMRLLQKAMLADVVLVRATKASDLEMTKPSAGGCEVSEMILKARAEMLPP